MTLVGDNQIPAFDPVARAAALGISDRVVWHTWMSETDLDCAYWTSRAFIFLSDLARHLPGNTTLDFMAVSSYGTSTKSDSMPPYSTPDSGCMP